MHVEIKGDEGSDLVLLHGGIGTGYSHWSKLIGELRRRHRVHLPDLPGHGRSPLADDGAYSRALLVGAVADYLRGLDRPVHLGGFSMGGQVLLALAQERPGWFASLCLVGVSIRPHQGLDGWREKFEPGRLEREHPLWALYLARIHEPLGGPDAWRDVCRRDAAGIALDVDLEALGALACPILLVRGDRDPVADPGQYAALRSVWPHADEFVVPAGGHDVQLTRRRLVSPALVDFLSRAEGGERR